MSSADWRVGDMPSEPTTDLFDGDILGDELMDIYNAAVVGGGDDDMNEIPALLAPTPESSKKEPVETEDTEAATQDDGLGAFRPSTSFNDLSTLLPSTEQAPPAAPQSGLSPGSLATLAPEDAGSKKRAFATSHADAPVAKKRTTSSRKGSASGATSKSKSKAANGSTNQKASKAAARAKPHTTAKGKQYSKNDTPNPLTIGKPQPPMLVAKMPSAKSSTKPTVVHSAVVTPRAPVPTKEAEKKNTVAPSQSMDTPTEADFKSVAQAAVSSLIVNAGNGAKGDTAANSAKDASGKVDTSTEHIKALTGSNWVSVCAGGDIPASSGPNADKMNNRARRQNLTPDERARQNRDRNREHARNTRLRKKAYVEELKRTLTSLVAQRDAADLEKRHTVQRELEQREVRFRVIEEFLKLRSRNEVNFARWAAILEDTFTFTLPITDFRSMVHSERVQQSGAFEQTLTGVSEAMADSGLLTSFVQSLGKQSGKEAITFAFSCDRKNFFMDNCYAVLDWTASTRGAVEQGATSEVTIKGNLKAHFSPASNKLISVVMTFDTGAVVSQVNQILRGNSGSAEEMDAAQVAASEADAILDSLQMPHMPSVPTNVTLRRHSSGPASITDVEKEDSSDESNGESDDAARTTIGSRLVLQQGIGHGAAFSDFK
eukprot:scaffold1377_cov126-Cylindrotheca_fusiformis.AAC.22